MFTELKRWIKLVKIILQRKSIQFGSRTNIAYNSVFEGQNKIGKRTWFDGYIGYGSYIGEECTISAKIGRFCSIGHKVTILTGTHPSHKYVSTNPVFFSLGLQNGTTYVKKQKFKEKIYANEEYKYGVIIGNDVWIGYNVTIMGGCIIGDGAIIGANAFVNTNVDPYSIIAGQPAKIIKKRFTQEQIMWLNNFKWWDMPIEWIKSHANDFDDIEKFIEKYN